MENMLLFFSYSRKDTDFAVKLANDLRKSGVTIWIDQDILPGEQWDNSIEKALDTSTCLIVILSPNSVQSANVLNEVHYAIDNRKTIIPVLYKDCKLPLLLLRYQYTPFIDDYQNGLKLLHKALGIEHPIKEDENKAITNLPKLQDDSASEVKISEDPNTILLTLSKSPDRVKKKISEHNERAKDLLFKKDFTNAIIQIRSALFLDPKNHNTLTLQTKINIQIYQINTQRKKYSNIKIFLFAAFSLVIVIISLIWLFSSSFIYNGFFNKALPIGFILFVFYLIEKFAKKTTSDIINEEFERTTKYSDKYYDDLTIHFRKKGHLEFEKTYLEYSKNFELIWNMSFTDFVTLEKFAIILDYLLCMDLKRLIPLSYREKFLATLKKGAEIQGGNCLYLLGVIYESGLLGVEQNLEIAKMYYEKAIEINNAKAMNALARMYRDGTIVTPINLAIAKSLLETAFKTGF